MVEESADGVRLMTVHTAKGLEFPVVILADMTANICVARPGPLSRSRAPAVCATRDAVRAPRTGG